MKALVTGSTGLIGRALCERLSREGWEVRGLSSFDMNKIPFLYSVDLIVHLGCYAAPKKFLADPLRTIESNTQVTQFLLDMAKKHDAKFLFASSSQIYGNATMVPTPEDYPGNTTPQDHRAPYIESKRLGETICSVYQDTVDVKVARLCSVFGPTKLDDLRVIPQMIYQAITNHKIVLLDSGSKERTWIYVDDAVDMMLRIASKGLNLVYNVAGMEKASIRTLAENIADITESELIVPREDNGLLGAPEVMEPSIERYVSEFGKPAFTPIREGLRKTIRKALEAIKPGS